MLVFIDESGDAGMKLGEGSSPIFVVTAVIFTDRAVAEECDRHIVEIRKQLSLSPHKEFHFSTDNRKIRTHFLTEVSRFDFRFSSVVLNKARITGPGFNVKESLYKYTSQLVVSNIRDCLVEATVVIDKCGDKEFRSQLARYLGRHANTEDAPRRIKKTKMEKSHTNNLLQLADMVSGAVARCYSSNETGRWQYRQLVRQREMRVQVWPALS
jgi:hypothetical protein